MNEKIKFSTAFILGESGCDEEEKGEEMSLDDHSNDTSDTSPEHEDVLFPSDNNYQPIPLPSQLLSTGVLNQFLNIIGMRNMKTGVLKNTSNVNILTNLLLQQYIQKMDLKPDVQAPEVNLQQSKPLSMHSSIFNGSFSNGSCWPEAMDDRKAVMKPKASSLIMKSSFNSTETTRQPYTETELSAAVKAICFGRLGTRRAASVYGIPRSTLRNKICKLNELKKREEERLGNGPISMSDFLMYLNKDSKELQRCNELNGNEVERNHSQIASRIASVFQVNCRRSNVLRTRQVNSSKCTNSPKSIIPCEANSFLSLQKKSSKLNLSVKRKYSSRGLYEEDSLGKNSSVYSDVAFKCAESISKPSSQSINDVMNAMKNLTEYFDQNK